MKTTRRGLVALVAVPLTLGLPVAAVAAEAERRAFIKQLAYWHKYGAEVALRALEAGCDPADLNFVRLTSLDDPDSEPAMHFDAAGDRDSEVVVDRRGVRTQRRAWPPPRRR